MRIPFDEYAPDAPELGPGSSNIQDVIPIGESYSSFPAPVVYSSALDARARGAIGVKDNTGVVYNYAGDATKLYTLSDDTYNEALKNVTGTDISFAATSTINSTTTDLSVFNNGEKIVVTGSASNNLTLTVSGTPTTTSLTVSETNITTEAAGSSVTITRNYTNGDNDNWEFVKWNETVIGTNWADDPQSITLGASNFDRLHEDAPKAKHLAVVANDFLVLGNVDNSGTPVPNRVQWSGLNDLTSWGSVAATQADFNDLKGNGGAVQHISGGRVGYIFQQRSIQTMTYIGPPIVFEFREVEPGRGTPAPHSVVRWGNNAYYLGHDGFAVFNGAASQSIGNGKVDRTFYDDLDQSHLDKVFAAIDPVNHIIAWLYAGAGNSGIPNKMLCYNFITNRWAPINIDAQFITGTFSQGYTMDSLDSLSTNLDSLTIPLDSDFYKGGALLFSMFDTNNKLNNFQGAAKAGVVETAEIELSPGRLTFVDEVRPLTDATTTLIVSTRDNQTDSSTDSSSYSINSYDSTFSTREEARYYKFRLTTDGTAFNHLQGVDVKGKATGER